MPTQTSSASPGQLLAAIRDHGGLTRQELMVRSGMSRSTLGGRLDLLLRAGWVRESHRLSSTGGRPASVIVFDSRDRVVLTIDVGHSRIAVSVYTVDGECLREAVIERESIPLWELVEVVSELGARQLESVTSHRLLGVGLALPAPVVTHAGTRLASIAMPDPHYPVAEVLADRFGVAVIVENDARAFTVGAATEVEPIDGDDVIIGVKFSTGIGIGLLSAGHVLQGARGAAGALGHLRITPDAGPRCTCGRRGCLASYAAGRAILRDLDRPAVTTVSELAHLYDQHDPDASRLIDAAASLLGAHLGGFVQVTDPHYVVFGGILGGRPGIAEQIVTALKQAVAPGLDARTKYRVADGDHTTAAGLTSLVLEHVLSPVSVDRLLGA